MSLVEPNSHESSLTLDDEKELEGGDASTRELAIARLVRHLYLKVSFEVSIPSKLVTDTLMVIDT